MNKTKLASIILLALFAAFSFNMKVYAGASNTTLEERVDNLEVSLESLYNDTMKLHQRIGGHATATNMNLHSINEIKENLTSIQEQLDTTNYRINQIEDKYETYEKKMTTIRYLLLGGFGATLGIGGILGYLLGTRKQEDGRR